MSCQPLKKLFTHFLGMPYYKNYAASSGAVHNYAKHEDAIARALEDHDYTRFASAKKLKKKDFGQDGFLADMPLGSFIEQYYQNPFL